MPGSAQITARVKELALEMGFARAGVASVGALKGAEEFEGWIAAGNHAGMSYLARNISARFDPAHLLGGARSVICLAAAYAPDPTAPPAPANAPRAFVARYARGEDYHNVLKRRAHRLMDKIRDIAPTFEGRAFAGSAPLSERSLSAAAGIGWIGKNGCLIVEGLGSYVVLAEIVCNLDLHPDAPAEPRCADCDACVRACPTGAILDDSLVDARLCLSYLSIEHRGEVPAKLRELWGGTVFGCDACQEPCPYNRDAPAGDPELTQRPKGASGDGIHGCRLADVLRWSQEQWATATRKASTRRASYEMFLRNAVLAAASSGEASLIEPLEQLRDRQPQIRELIVWARERLLHPGGN